MSKKAKTTENLENLTKERRNSSQTNETNTRTLYLKSKDGKLFAISDQACNQLSVCRLAFSIEKSDINDAEPLIVPNVEGVILEKVIAWAEHHKNDQCLEEDEVALEKRRDSPLNSWDEKFLNRPQFILFDLMMAANYLWVPGLLEATGKKIASLIKGKTAQEIRSTFNIQNDFSEEEEAQLIKENKWAEEIPLRFNK